jgi:glycine/D-amino acid oxidase-like deaminating enzyme
MAAPDYLIVGAGLAGLYTALKIKEAKPEAQVQVIEKYNYIGGRVVTHRHSTNQWEIGAGRIHKSHHLVRGLMRRYDLTWTPISDESLFQAHDGASLSPNKFNELARVFLEPLLRLSADVLARHTVQELLLKFHSQSVVDRFLGSFPYRAEVTVMRADAAIAELLAPVSGVMGSDFGVCREGLDRIVAGLATELVGLGVPIHLGHTLTQVHGTHLTVRVGGELKEMSGKKVILALHAKAMKSIRGLSTWPILQQLVMCPLLRTYAVYDEPWFGDQKIVFGANPVRYFIPVNSHTAMCSYTDAGDTRPWMHDAEHNPKRLCLRIHQALRRAFPDRHIPDPSYFKAHPWSAGCTYWTPVPAGTAVKSPKDLSRSALQFAPNVYVCGESFSADKQTWMEGALEHADMLLKHIP